MHKNCHLDNFKALETIHSVIRWFPCYAFRLVKVRPYKPQTPMLPTIVILSCVLHMIVILSCGAHMLNVPKLGTVRPFLNETQHIIDIHTTHIYVPVSVS